MLRRICNAITMGLAVALPGEAAQEAPPPPRRVVRTLSEDDVYVPPAARAPVTATDASIEDVVKNLTERTNTPAQTFRELLEHIDQKHGDNNGRVSIEEMHEHHRRHRKTTTSEAVHEELHRLLDGETRTNTRVVTNGRITQAQLDQCRQLNISYPNRLGSCLTEVLENRSQPEVKDDRPLAVIVFPKSDWNGAYQPAIRDPKLLNYYRVLYYEAQTDTEFYNCLKDATQAEKAELLVIGGHGTRSYLAFGAHDPARSRIDRESYYLDLNDGDEMRQANLKDMVADGANIVLKSCSSGQGRERSTNMVNALAKIWPQANLWGPESSTNNGLRLDAQGKFVHPGYYTSRTYHVPPKNDP